MHTTQSRLTELQSLLIFHLFYEMTIAFAFSNAILDLHASNSFLIFCKHTSRFPLSPEINTDSRCQLINKCKP